MKKLKRPTFDKALITAGKAPRFATSQINVQSNIKNTIKDLSDEELRIEAERLGIFLQSPTLILTKEDAHRQYLEFIKG